MSICILSALGKQTELSAHVKGALNNGVTEEELKYEANSVHLKGTDLSLIPF